MSERHLITMQAAVKVREWLKAGRGVAVWRSINLSNPDGQWLTPARTEDGKTMTKQSWEMPNEPNQVFEKVEDFRVGIDREVKRFHVAVRMGSQGFSYKVTDAGSARIRSEVEKAGDNAYHVFDYGDYKNAVIMAPDKIINLEDWNG